MPFYAYAKMPQSYAIQPHSNQPKLHAIKQQNASLTYTRPLIHPTPSLFTHNHPD